MRYAILGLMGVFAVGACGDDERRATEDDDGAGASGAGFVGAGGTGLVASGGGDVGGMSAGGAHAGGMGTGGPGVGGGASGPGGGGASGPTGCGPDGLALIAAINDYRADHSLPAIPASSSLCIVAETHVNDLRDHAPHQVGNCNLHSWSDQGTWTPCCYTPDHAAAQCMWVKPSELAGYNSSGYEISAAGVSTPSGAVQLWANSSGHNAVILNEGSWANLTWNAIGAAQHDGFAHVWFGTLADPN